MRIRYEEPPTVSEFFDSDAFVRVLMGPVGSGKSSACVMEILRRAMAQEAGPDGLKRTRFAVIRNTYGQLRDTTRKTFEQWIPEGLGKWHEQEFTFHLRFGNVDCEVLFRALDRPEDVKKLLSLELTGAYVNEGREIPKAVFDVLQSRVGRYPSKLQGGPSWFGIWMDSNPWHSTHWGAKLFKASPEGHALFRQPGGRSDDAENTDNLPAGYYHRLCIGKDSEWVRVYVDGLDASADVGSIYGQALDALEARGAVSEFQHPFDGMFTSWDLGVSDATAIWFWRIGENRLPCVVDHYEASGRPLSHFFEVVEGKGFSYSKHWLPHDARARTLQTGVSTLDQFADRYGPGLVSIGPALSVEDGISAGRWLLEQPIQVHRRCESALETLKAYRYEWSDRDQVFSRKPLHNFASHTADAWRYLACVAKHSELLTRPEPKKADRPKYLHETTLSELMAQHGVDL